MNLSIPRVASTVNITYIWESWADVFTCILHIKKLLFEEVKWVFAIIPFTWEHSVFIKMYQFWNWTGPIGVKK